MQHFLYSAVPRTHKNVEYLTVYTPFNSGPRKPEVLCLMATAPFICEGESMCGVGTYAEMSLEQYERNSDSNM
jgi:hypothetical protein